MRQDGKHRSDRGESLVEVLVTVVILGIAGVAIVAGLGLSVKTSDLGRKQANGGTYVRSLAEAVQNAVAAGGYSASCGNYATAAIQAAAGIPSSYTIAQTAIQTWTGSAWVACTSANQNGIQRVDLQVSSPAGSVGTQAVEKLTTIIRRPCSGAVPSPGNLTATPC